MKLNTINLEQLLKYSKNTLLKTNDINNNRYCNKSLRRKSICIKGFYLTLLGIDLNHHGLVDVTFKKRVANLFVFYNIRIYLEETQSVHTLVINNLRHEYNLLPTNTLEQLNYIVSLYK